MSQNKDCFDYIMPYHVSLGSSLGTTLSEPEGSGILVKFSVQSEQGSIPVYGVLTAAHVLEIINLLPDPKAGYAFIGLLKPSDRQGNQHASICPVDFLISKFDNKYFRYLKQNQHGDLYCEQDIAFISIARHGYLPQNDVINNSTFYDLDSPPILCPIKKHSLPMVFFKGACCDSEIKNGVLNTNIYVTNGGMIKQYPKSKILYHDIPIHCEQSMKGSSGAGLWLCVYDEDDSVKTLLQGIIVKQKADLQNHCIYGVQALDISYVYECFLPQLKLDCITHNFV